MLLLTFCVFVKAFDFDELLINASTPDRRRAPQGFLSHLEKVAIRVRTGSEQATHSREFFDITRKLNLFRVSEIYGEKDATFATLIQEDSTVEKNNKLCIFSKVHFLQLSHKDGVVHWWKQDEQRVKNTCEPNRTAQCAEANPVQARWEAMHTTRGSDTFGEWLDEYFTSDVAYHLNGKLIGNGFEALAGGLRLPNTSSPLTTTWTTLPLQTAYGANWVAEERTTSYVFKGKLRHRRSIVFADLDANKKINSFTEYTLPQKTFQASGELPSVNFCEHKGVNLHLWLLRTEPSSVEDAEDEADMVLSFLNAQDLLKHNKSIKFSIVNCNTEAHLCGDDINPAPSTPTIRAYSRRNGFGAHNLVGLETTDDLIQYATQLHAAVDREVCGPAAVGCVGDPCYCRRQPDCAAPS